ncbi:MAG: hypothetical protein A2527_02125 [Candidatus Lambdaproteobacteria bacterium RIFOXYD2_FULL_50_16]|uniref:LamG-like jellyroll fold domain-containing protein n=1 Tax=Candidatus Lambdaproteobacteria bacterium RIFOXYD2_FULL_50_16 TaxID=1817772 RepID=A0A1F6GE39_9PROT|nr:MAG: hypothetical protein A2527_02125 [Candidatus Lambdaproteobacteria bacterium RIFOXYD2_FULL_50_16]
MKILGLWLRFVGAFLLGLTAIVLYLQAEVWGHRHLSDPTPLPFEQGLTAYYPLAQGLGASHSEAPQLIFYARREQAKGGLYLGGGEKDFLQVDDWFKRQNRDAQEQTMALWVWPQFEQLQYASELPVFWDGDLKSPGRPIHSLWIKNKGKLIHHSLTRIDSFDLETKLPEGPVFLTSILSYREKMVRFYIDGQLAYQGTTEAPGLETTDTLYLGRGLEPERRFNGILGGWTIWNRALSPQEVNQLYQHDQTQQALYANEAGRKTLLYRLVALGLALVGLWLSVPMLRSLRAILKPPTKALHGVFLKAPKPQIIGAVKFISLAQTLGLFGLLLGALYFIYADNFNLPTAHHDQTRYFTEYGTDLANKASCAFDRQHKWLFLVGRPISAFLECQVATRVFVLQDLVFFRFLVLILMAAGATLLAVLAVAVGLPLGVAGLMALAIYCLPGAQNTIFMTNLPNALAPLLGLMSYGALLWPSKTYYQLFGRYLSSLLLLLLATLTYPALSYLFLAPSFLALAFAPFSGRFFWRTGLHLAIRDMALLGAASFGFLLVVKKVIHPLMDYQPSMLPENYQVSLNFSQFWVKLDAFFQAAMPWAFNYWNVYVSEYWGNRLAWVICLAAVIFSLVRWASEKRGALVVNLYSRVFPAAAFLFVSMLPWVLSHTGHLLYRFLMPLSVLALLVLFVLWVRGVELAGLVGLKPKAQKITLYLGAAALALYGAMSANRTTSLNTWNTSVELAYARSILAQYQGKPIKRIHIIRAANDKVGFNGLPSVTDEFNRKSLDIQANVSAFIRLALLGVARHETFSISDCQREQRYCPVETGDQTIFVTHSELGEPVYKSRDMVVIDFNYLFNGNSGKQITDIPWPELP